MSKSADNREHRAIAIAVITEQVPTIIHYVCVLIHRQVPFPCTELRAYEYPTTQVSTQGLSFEC